MGRSRRSVERSQTMRSDMQIKETPDVSFPGVVESPALEDVVVLADGAGVALGVQRAFSARVRSVRDDGSGLIASRCVEIPLVGRDGEISGAQVLTAAKQGTRIPFYSRRQEGNTPRVSGCGAVRHRTPEISPSRDRKSTRLNSSHT